MRSISNLFWSLQKILIEPPSHIQDVEIRHKSRLLNGFLLFMILVFFGVDGVYLATLPGYMPPWYGYVFLFVSYILNRSRFYTIAAFITLAMFPVVIFVNIVSGGAANPVSTIYYLAPGIVLAGILLSVQATAFFVLIEIAVVISMTFVMPDEFPTIATIVGPVSIMSISTVLVLVSVWFRNQVEKDRQEMVRLTEERYRNIFENAIDGFFQSTTDGRFINVNPAMARIYGYDSPKDMIQKVTNIGSQLYVDPELRNVLRRRMAEDEKITGFESQDYRKDGSKIWTSMNARAIRDAQGNILYYEGIVEDITLRKEMEIKQKEAETLYRTLVEQTSIVAYRDAPDESASPIYISPQIETLLGYTANEWLSDPSFWKTRIHPEDLPRVLADIEHYIVNKDKSSIEYRMQTKTGDWRWVRDETVIVKDEAGNAQFIHGVFLDITERKQAENALLQFRKLMDESNDAIFLVDPQTSRYIDFNRSAYEKLGYSRKELSQLGVIDIAQHVTSMDIWHGRVELISEQKNGLIFESVYQRKDRTMFPVEVSARMLDYEDRTILLAIVRDITERKHSETALLESEERFHKIFNSSPIAICITTSEEGRLLDANNAYWDITGYPAETSIGRNAEELKMWDDPRKRVDFVQELRQKHSISNPDDYFFHTDGSLKQVISFYELIFIGDQECILSMFYDMSTQKQLESERENLIRQLEIQNAETETLRESFASLVGTFEFAEIIEHILDQIKRVVPFDSASIWRLEGRVQKLIASRNLPPDNPIEEMEIKVDEINSAFPILRGEVPYILKHNVQAELLDFKDPPHNIINSWLAIPLKTRGKIIGLIALDGYRNNQFNDHHAQLAVTFANQVAIALENARLFSELQSELITREKLIKELESKNTELERFTYTVSHDLRSPLVTINGFLGYLKGDTASGNSDRVTTDIQRIQDAVDKMHVLLKELLELSRIGRIMNPPETASFEDLVREALEIVHGRLEAHRVTVHTQPNLPAIQGDRQRLIEVLQNLIENAAKYMGKQVTPNIEIGQHGEEDGKLIFYIKDNGMGIPPEHHERIFGLFDKLDPKSEGTGVGLALVKRIIEVHGGRIWVESEAGNGSTFYFTLPKSENIN